MSREDSFQGLTAQEISKEEKFPLTPAQQRIWVLEQLLPEKALHNIPVVLKISGNFDFNTLQNTIQRLIKKHEALRSHFVSSEEDVFRILNQESLLDFTLTTVDLQHLDPMEANKEIDRLITSETERPFNLATGPLFRCQLITLTEKTAFLVVTTHAIIFDKASEKILIQEICALYDGDNAPNIEPVENKEAANDDQWKYWKRQLEGVPDLLQLPLTKNRLIDPSFLTHFHTFDLNKSLKEWPAETMLLSALMLLLHRYSGQNDIVVGIPASGRKTAIGLHKNYLAIKVSFDQLETFEDLLFSVQNACEDSRKNQDVPFELLVENLNIERAPNRHPIFQVALNISEEEVLYGTRDVKVERVEPSLLKSDLDIALTIINTSDIFKVNIRYASDLFDEEFGARFEGHLLNTLDAMGHTPELSIRSFEFLNQDERVQILQDWNKTETAFPLDKTIHGLFEEQAERTPEAAAIYFNKTRLSYCEFNSQSNQLAHFLINECKIKVGAPIALCLERSEQMLVAIQAILKAGGAYVPIDPAFPEDRIRYILEDTQSSIVITQESHCHLFEKDHCLFIDSQVTQKLLSEKSETNPNLPINSNNIAYILYTSGTSGRPKGVMIEHQGIVNRLFWKNSVYPIQQDDKFLQKSPYTFDVSVVELFLVHWFGGSVVFAKPGGHKDPEYLKRLIEKESITIIHFVPSMLEVFLDTLNSSKESLPSLRLVACSGESLTHNTVKRFYERVENTELYNLYGPTEASVDVLMYDCKEIKGNEVYIGKPIANTQAYVLDENQMPLPIGAIGELYIGGVQLAKEYLNRPDLTAEKFVLSPFNSKQRLYKTGDLVKWMPDGNIAFLGRNDNQVKIRGFRIELDEITTVLSNHSEVKQAVADVRVHGGSQHLVAYCVKEFELDEADEKEYVTTWGSLFDSEYSSMEGADVRLNISGWKSSYTGLQIKTDEMREWTHETVKRIQTLCPKVILEIGSGSGLILFNIIDSCEGYYATDISQNVIDYTDKIVSQQPWKDKVETACCIADDIPYEKFKRAYDTVVINSVIQLFPNLDYLEGVILEAIAYMGDTGQVFIGDVRDYRLLHCFHYSVLKYKNGKATKAEVDHFVRREKELLISPEYFVYLQATTPHITHVEIMPKMGVAQHEMNRFRYDVILHIDKKARQKTNYESIKSSEFVPVKDCFSYMDSHEEDILCMKYLNQRVVNDYAAYHDLKIDSNQELLEINAIAEEAKQRGYQVKFYLDLNNPHCLDILMLRNKQARVLFTCQSQRVDFANNPLINSKLIENSFAQKLKKYLSLKLPEFMIPEHYILLDSLPITSNGKLDRKALPEVLFISSGKYVAPRNELETEVHTIWADMLGLPGDKVSVVDDFFRLGGNSILAIKLTNQLNKNLQQNVKVADIFLHRSIEKLVQSFSSVTQKKISIDKGIFSTTKDQVLSFAQERLWFIQTYEKGTTVYNIPMIYQLSKGVDINALSQSLTRIVERHEVLRTLIKEDNEGNGYSQILDSETFHIQRFEVEADLLNIELDRDIHHVFDLSRESPAKMKIYNVSDGRCFLSIIIHHVAFDGWSLDIFLKELEAHYAFYSGCSSIQLPEPKLQYKDFAKWQRNYLHGERLEKQLSYWKGKLEGYETLNLVTDKARPNKIDYSGSDIFFKFDKQLSMQLKTLAQEMKVSLYSLLLSAYYLMLKVYSNQNDLVVGTPIANRHFNDIDEMIGFFVNSLILRNKISSDTNLESYIRKVASDVAEAQAHQDLPFEKLVAELDITKDKSRHPLFQVMFTVQSFGGRLENPLNHRLASIMHPYDSKLSLFQAAYFDLTTFIDDSKEELEGRFNYATALFDKETIAGYVATYEHILRQLVEADCSQTHLSEITTIDQDEYKRIVYERNQTAIHYPKKTGVHQLVEQYAKETPEADAIVYEELTLSYAELNRRANQLAHLLVKEHHLKSEELVGICLDDNLEMIVASLGVLKAGGAFVPMDLKLPDERLHYIQSDANLSLVITNAVLAKRLGTSKWISLDEIENQPESNLVMQGSLAQVLYTSGTTGFPKGVMIDHHNIVSLVKNTNFIDIKPSDSFIQLADTTFDASTLEIWGPLLNGGRVVLVKNKMDLFASSQLLKETLDKHAVTVLWLTKALFDQIFMENKETFSSLNTLIVGGEALNKKLIEELVSSKHAPKHLINGYGPTECTTFSCTLEITKEALQAAKSVPIGRPIANKSAYVLNEEMSPLPIGAVGELHIGGAGCARGYLNNPEQTAKKFVPHPFIEGAVLYKTGDLARWLPDGNLEFIGRNDFQVKLHGYRIELEEIESVLSKHEEIKQAVTLIKESRGNKNLVAYCVKEMQLGELETQEFVSTWESLYQSEYNALNPLDFKLNIKGWNSSYTSQPIPAKDMQEWVQETVKRIAGQNPQTILEIGSGSGLILFNIFDKCSHYIATDFSKSVIDYTNQVVTSHAMEEKVKTLCCPADQIPYAELGKEYDTVVINSVIQYFPHLDYLESVILKAITHMGDAGRVFIGDIRDYRLLKCFHFSVLKYKGEATTKGEVDHFVRREKELLISPEYFVYLKGKNPDIASVELLPKMGRADHEMNNYRYDVILHINKKAKACIDEVDEGNFVHVDDIATSIDSRGDEPLLIKYFNKRVLSDYAEYYDLKIDRKQQLLDMDAIAEMAQEKGCQVKFFLNLSSPLYFNIAIYTQGEVQIKHKTEAQRQELANNPLITSKLVDNEFAHELKNYLFKKLPEYMIPEHYVLMDKLPTTSNGKLDRKALPEIGFVGSGDHTPPRNELERQVLAVWAAVLGLSENKLSISDNFFRLGGNSILAIKLANKLNQSLQQNVKVSDIFTYPSVEKLAQNLQSNQARNISIEKGRFLNEKEQILSFAQERLWFIQTYERGTNVYNVPLTFELKEQIDLEALKKSLSTIIKRHEILRTIIKEDAEGNGYQVVLEETELTMPFIKTSQLNDELNKEVNHIFNLRNEIPTRIRFYEETGGRRFLSIVIHHASFDGWSYDLLLKELDAFYAYYTGVSAKALPEPKIQYKDFAKWQRNYLKGEKKQLTYWLNKLTGYETLQLPTKKIRPQQVSYEGSNVFFKFDQYLSNNLRELAKCLGVSLYTLTLSAYYLLLKTYSNQNDIVVGSPVANRHYNEIEEMIGFFVNNLVLRSIIKPEMKIEEFIHKTSKEVIEAQAHQDVPFEKLVEKLELSKDTSRHPLFQVMFTVQSFGSQLEDQINRWKELDGIQLAKVMHPYDSKLSLFQAAYFDLTTFIDDSKEELEGRFNYATALFDKETIEGYVATYEHILRQLIEADCSQTRLSEITTIDQDVYKRVVYEGNQTATHYPKKTGVHQLVEQYAKKTPEADAIVYEELTISYAELNRRANQLAHFLVKEHHLKSEELVGICLDDNLEMIVASLGVLKAGGAFVPMDLKLPDERLQYIQKDANLSLVITNASLSKRLGISKWISLDSLENQPDSNLARKSSLAQVLYTSGTTGFPKGVMIEHHNIVSLVKNTSFIEIKPSDSFIQLADATFDASTLEIWGPLLNGARVVLVKNKMDLFASSQLLKETLDKYSITVLWLTKALFDQIFMENKETFSHLDTLIVGGEALNKKLIEELVSSKHAPKHLINGYGPTECTTFSCTLEITKEALQSAKSVPIGKPIANKSAYVLNEEMSPLPVGAVGELHIGGAGCARGYLKNPEQTAKKFVPHPFLEGAVLYKTGDLARWLPDGNLEFIGRNDFQVKLHGYRIELEEIESVLSKHEEIKQAVTLIKESQGNKNLVAYCVKELQLGELETQEFVSTWESLYQSEYNALNPLDFKLNIKGWNSSYTGQPIPASHMQEWVQETVKRIAGQNPQTILEIGSGSGLILFNIYDKCSHYIATDFSKSVIDYTDQVVTSHAMEEKVKTLCCPADQIPYAKLGKEYDTVVINSVIQYFPHLDYLESVILEAIAHMGDTGRVFIGDIRDYRLLKCFHFSVLKYKGEATTKGEVDHFVRREKELLISPEYFVYLKGKNPDIASVELLPKMGRADHEMNNYRYDVILHIDKRAKGQIKEVDEGDFVHVDDIAASVDSLGDEPLLIKYLNKRVLSDYAEYYDLKIDRKQQLLDMNDMAEIAHKKGCQVKFFLNLSSPLYLNIAIYTKENIQIKYKTQRQRQELANNPLVTSKLVDNEFAKELKNYLLKKLPEYMIPEHYVLMDKLPTTSNGKLDRKALPEIGFIGCGDYTPPRSELERQLQAIWSKVLGLSEKNVSIKGEFFRLGGNSILAIKLANQLNKHLQLNIKVSDIFTYPTIEKLNEYLTTLKEEDHLGETYVF